MPALKAGESCGQAAMMAARSGSVGQLSVGMEWATGAADGSNSYHSFWDLGRHEDRGGRPEGADPKGP
jgi:hypothetical protein